MKLIGVYPGGRAYNLDETIQRLRYRNGYDMPQVWMESGKVYKVTLQSMTASNFLEAGHRIRLEAQLGESSILRRVAPSPRLPVAFSLRFDRNMNTGGKNYGNLVASSHTTPSTTRSSAERISQY